VRELDERLGLGELTEQHLRDPRRGQNTPFPLADLFRQSVYNRLAGYEDVHDAERLSQDPTFRLLGSEKISRARRGADFPVAIPRDQDAGRRRELRRLGADQPPTTVTSSPAAIRLPANDCLERDIAALRSRPPGRASSKPVVRYKSFLYQAASWTKARRVVAKVECHCGELFPRVGFIVTNLETDGRAVVRFYNKCGTAVKMTRLSCHRFRANEVRLYLSVIAYNLGNLWRRLVLPLRVGKWSLTGLQQRLVKTGGRLIKHARYYWLLRAEGHLTRRLFGAMLRRGPQGAPALPAPAG